MQTKTDIVAGIRHIYTELETVESNYQMGLALGTLVGLVYALGDAEANRLKMIVATVGARGGSPIEVFSDPYIKLLAYS